MDKRGVLGFDTARAVFVALMIIAVIAIVMILASSQLRDVAEATETKLTGTKLNETSTTINTSVYYTFTTVSELRNPTCTITTIQNRTGGTVISSSNYTQSGCALKLSDAAATGGLFNNTVWNISYTYTYNTPYANSISNNLTVSPINFFKQVPTFMTLLAVVVLILVITIVIIAVSRFTGEKGGANL